MASGAAARDDGRIERNLVVAVTGASGALYGRAFVRALARLVPGSSSLVVSEAGLRVFREELDGDVHSPDEYLSAVLAEVPAGEQLHRFQVEDSRDIGARPASGSAPYDGMVIVPCSMKTLAAIATGYTTSLVERAADVTLKERRRLIVVPRETPLHLVHLRNMQTLTEAGGIVLPAAPGFYQKPKTLEDLGNFIAGRILSLLGVPHDLFRPWDPQSR